MRFLILGVAIAGVLISSPAVAQKKKKSDPTALEIQQIQARDVEASKEITFGAVMSVLQDAGYRIQAADKDTGLITGISSTKSKLTYNLFWGFGKSKKSPIVSAFVEARGPNITNVRLSFVMAKVKSTLYGSQPQDEEPVYDPVVYRDAFDKIDQAIFIRKSVADPAPAISSNASSPSVSTVGVAEAAAKEQKPN